MGDYLLLQWLQSKRGFIIFLLLLLITAISGLFHLASYKETPKQTPAKNIFSGARTAKLPAK